MQSIWEQRSFGQPVDLTVVGAGLVGLWAAVHARRRWPQRRVLVVERGPHPSGASVRNAGFACFGSPSELLADLEAEGPDATLARVAERWQGLLELRMELGDAAIGYEPTGGHEVYAADDPLYTRVAEGFDRLNDLLRPITGPGTFHWLRDGADRFGLAPGTRVARTDREGPVDSGRLMQALLQLARQHGVEVRWDLPVERLEPAAHGVDLVTAHGPALRARQVLVATNGYARQLLPEVDVQPARGQVLLTAPIPGLRLQGTFHAHEGYYYFRDLGGAVLLGGARHLDKAGETTWDEGTSAHLQAALEDFLHRYILPDWRPAIAHRWSGVMGFRAQGKTPVVAPVRPGVVAAVGLSGMGVAIGIRVARQAVELLEG